LHFWRKNADKTASYSKWHEFERHSFAFQENRQDKLRNNEAYQNGPRSKFCWHAWDSKVTHANFGKLRNEKYMVMPRDQNAGQNGYIQIGNKFFRAVKQFKHLGTAPAN
jgi:hypothetical protein